MAIWEPIAERGRKTFENEHEEFVVTIPVEYPGIHATVVRSS